MRCEWCGLDFTGRADAKFCSGRCRVASHRRGGGPPDELTSRPRWVVHQGKVPRTPFGAAASSTNAQTWRDHATATAALAGSDGQLDGLGFVLTGDGIACIDLDHCLTDGSLDGWAAEIVARCPGTYIEVSLSGTGLHIFGYATVGHGRRGEQVEVYDRGRYICITGRCYRGAPRRLSDISGVTATI